MEITFSVTEYEALKNALENPVTPIGHEMELMAGVFHGVKCEIFKEGLMVPRYSVRFFVESNHKGD